MTSLLLVCYRSWCRPEGLGIGYIIKKIWQKEDKVRIKSLLTISLVLVLALVGLVGCTSEGTNGIELPPGLRININSQQEGESW